MSGKEDLEDIAGNTYGIEIEFGTHDCQMLSFTHIEVCRLYAKVSEDWSTNKWPDPKENGWTVETDADYTLELVSPILAFKDQAEARRFKADLMRLLERQVRDGILLTKLLYDDDINSIRGYISMNLAYRPDSGLWSYRDIIHDRNPTELTVDSINAEDLRDNLAWFNWDEDTDLERVLAARAILDGANGANYWNNAYQSILLIPSRKHGGLPSSQMNLPLTSNAYVTYDVNYKRKKAWERLLGVRVEDAEYKDAMRWRLAMAYPTLAGAEGDPVWKAKYMNDDYLDAQIDEKTPIWHRYWLWLETFARSAGIVAAGENIDTGVQDYLAQVAAVVGQGQFVTLTQARENLRELKYPDPAAMNEQRYRLTYLTIQKLVAGTFGTISEESQGLAQRRVMELNGDVEMDAILAAFPNREFLHFHYALKDLTPLWFKAPLMQVLALEDPNKEFRNVWQGLDAGKVASAIAGVLTANLMLLGWYYGVAQSCNREFDYDWDEFTSYNMPSTGAFSTALEYSCRQFKDYLSAEPKPPTVLCTLEQLPQSEVVFLQRRYANGTIAPWEGRWDTMKKPIERKGELPRYLVEHRNN